MPAHPRVVRLADEMSLRHCLLVVLAYISCLFVFGGMPAHPEIQGILAHPVSLEIGGMPSHPEIQGILGHPETQGSLAHYWRAFAGISGIQTRISLEL